MVYSSSPRIVNGTNSSPQIETDNPLSTGSRQNYYRSHKGTYGGRSPLRKTKQGILNGRNLNSHFRNKEHTTMILTNEKEGARSWSQAIKSRCILCEAPESTKDTPSSQLLCASGFSYYSSWTHSKQCYRRLEARTGVHRGHCSYDRNGPPSFLFELLHAPRLMHLISGLFCLGGC